MTVYSDSLALLFCDARLHSKVTTLTLQSVAEQYSLHRSPHVVFR